MSGPKLSPRGCVTLLLFLFLPLVSECAGNRSHHNSSVMDYLYPHGNTTVTEAKKPQLQLPLAFTYWSVIGAYVVRGEKNDTRTMLDTAVFDMNSNRMLFRAPGVSAVKGRATPVNLSEALREDSLEGFQHAADDMTVNLQQQLRQFTQSLRDNPDSADIQFRPGYAGGAGHWLLLVAGVVLAGMRSAQSWRMGRPGRPHSTWNFLPRGLSTRSKVCAPK
ncbi:hypothetical protein [Biformimicrobium ophioploci]|uniref:Uncharacterized protein n=1 Tax=Biformimicrobium ophioploci TaxID=3036711 RepID=A0ABQ6LUW8_9GAMM|nr:hypothetical protein [Microbulbifer sp. NKW57]GMG85852.1 hypothetical protein MNKW57_01730 [Microbulbifer sp. NKW57]